MFLERDVHRMFMGMDVLVMYLTVLGREGFIIGVFNFEN